MRARTLFGRCTKLAGPRAAMLMVWAGAASCPGQALELVYYDAADAQGRLSGGYTFVPGPTGDARHARPLPGATAVTLLDSGNPANRVDLVLVGDGYQLAQLGLYASHANSAVAQLFAQEPFKRYAPLFNVHRVDVVSVDSGVDNDPVQGISKNTALDMGFWCQGIDRLLCVSVNKAWQAAGAAPYAFDQILAVANSTMYGGAGYPTLDVATLAGGNGFSAEIAIHELGHSLGNLADEYDYGGPAVYTGSERPEPNVSIRTAAQMAAMATKWHLWLNHNDPAFDGLVSAFQGAYYSVSGIYRPTNNSKMRNLGRPFNPPSVEALVVEIYKEVKPIDDATAEGEVLSNSSVAYVDPVDPVGAPLSIQWSIDGALIPGAIGGSLSVASLGLSPGVHVLSVKVVDQTPWVRNAALRNQWLTQVRVWSVLIEASCYPDCNEDGLLTAADFGCFQSRYVAGDAYADCDGNGQRTVADFGCFQTRFVQGCP